MKARDIMTEDVATIRSSATVAEAVDVGAFFDLSEATLRNADGKSFLRTFRIGS